MLHTHSHIRRATCHPTVCIEVVFFTIIFHKVFDTQPASGQQNSFQVLEKKAQTGGIMGDKIKWRNKRFLLAYQKEFPVRSEQNTKLKKEIN